MTGFSGYEVQWLFFDQGIWRLDPSGGHGSRNIKTYKRNSDIMVTCFLKKQLNKWHAFPPNILNSFTPVSSMVPWERVFQRNPMNLLTKTLQNQSVMKGLAYVTGPFKLIPSSFLLCLCRVFSLPKTPPPKKPVRNTNSRGFSDLPEDKIFNCCTVELGADKLTNEVFKITKEVRCDNAGFLSQLLCYVQL